MTLIVTPRAPKTGEVFTRRWVVEALLDLSGYTADSPLETLRVVEPSVGAGAFVSVIVERLLNRAVVAGVKLETLRGAVRGYDLDPAHAETSRALCRAALVEAGASDELAADLANVWIRSGDWLLDETDGVEADVVAGNPPYIRREDVDPDTYAAYQHRWSTLAGRGDIYVAFWEKALSRIKPGGVVAFICADRWMRNSYGSRLRSLVTREASVEAIWSMHDVDAFEAAVAAYPAITVLRKGAQGKVVAAQTTSDFGAEGAAALVEFQRGDASAIETVGATAHRLDGWPYQGEALWPSGTPGRIDLVTHLAKTLPPLQRGSTRVGIGLATGADPIYIVKDAPVERDRLLPMVTGADLVGGEFTWGGTHLVNPWDEQGLVDLGKFPRLEAYYSASPRLRERYVAKAQPRRWYKTIDRPIQGLFERPKLVMRDLGMQAEPVLVPAGFYPHHNLYWVTSDEWDMEVLGGLLLSGIAQAFIEAYAVRMRGGTLRFQAQYLRTIALPRPQDIAGDVAEALLIAFRSRNRDAATAVAARACGIKALADYDL